MSENEQGADVRGEVRCIKARKLGWIDFLVIGVAILLLMCAFEAANVALNAPSNVAPNPRAQELLSFVEEGQSAPNPKCRSNEITPRVVLGYLITWEDLEWIRSYCKWKEKGAVVAPALRGLEANQQNEQRLYMRLKRPEQPSRIQF